MSGRELGGRPHLLVLVAAVTALLLVLPPLGLLLDTSWGRLPDQASDPDTLRALWLSALTSVLATAIAGVLGVPLAWLLARLAFPGRAVVRALVLLPLVLPPVVAGVALLSVFGRSGLIGGPLYDLAGVSLPFSTPGVVVAHVFIALPFVVLGVEGAFRGLDPGYERAAATLGASRWTALRRVVLPLVAPGIAAGLALGWARSLGEFGATITFAGNYPGTTRTMPVLVYTVLQDDPAAARGLSVLMMGAALIVLVLLRGRWIGGLR
ncbi:MAG: molybdate ABC transporter permease subunit [Actinobacteria bacterium]|nr:molybdate ABC transporter permease subunit [Actinomycetota bacterium]